MVERSDRKSGLSLSLATPGQVEQRAKIFAALADPTRLRVVELLSSHDKLSGSEIAAQLGISLALFCHHSKTLAEAGLVKICRQGQTKYHSLNRDLLTQCFASLEEAGAAIDPPD